MSNVLDKSNFAELIQALKAAEGNCFTIPCRYRLRFAREDYGGAYVLQIERLPPVENESESLQRLADQIRYCCNPDHVEPLELSIKVNGEHFRIQINHVHSSEDVEVTKDEA